MVLTHLVAGAVRANGFAANSAMKTKSTAANDMSSKPFGSTWCPAEAYSSGIVKCA